MTQTEGSLNIPPTQYRKLRCYPEVYLSIIQNKYKTTSVDFLL